MTKTPKRTPWMIGFAIFAVTFIAGWIVTQRHSGTIGFAEIVGIFHAAMGIGFASGFLSYVLINALVSGRRT